jgi:hypothetical protein
VHEICYLIHRNVDERGSGQTSRSPHPKDFPGRHVDVLNYNRVRLDASRKEMLRLKEIMIIFLKITVLGLLGGCERYWRRFAVYNVPDEFGFVDESALKRQPIFRMDYCLLFCLTEGKCHEL